MAKQIKKNKDTFLDELEDTINKSKPKVNIEIESNIKDSIDIPEIKPFEDTNILINKELAKFELQINEVDTVLDSINPLSISDPEERLKVLKLKIDILGKKPLLLASLDSLRTKDKLKTDQIKGNKDISPLEDGSLD